MKRLQHGFTLVEIVVVVTVVAILASLVIVTFITTQKRARDDTRSNQIKAIKTALQHYYHDNGEYPDVCGGANIDCDASNLSSALSPAYMQSIPTPPLGSSNNTYIYRRGSAADSYGLRVFVETSTYSYQGWACKTGNNIDESWRGGSFAPNCGF